jgi:hypothetical protein
MERHGTGWNAFIPYYYKIVTAEVRVTAEDRVTSR